MKISNPKAVQEKAKTHEVTPLNRGVFRVKSGSSGSEYLVRLQPGDNGAVCDCPWGQHRRYADHYRSGCSHVQAVVAHLEAQQGRVVSAWGSAEDARRQRRPVINLGDGVLLTARKV